MKANETSVFVHPRGIGLGLTHKFEIPDVAQRQSVSGALLRVPVSTPGALPLLMFVVASTTGRDGHVWFVRRKGYSCMVRAYLPLDVTDIIPVEVHLPNTDVDRAMFLAVGLDNGSIAAQLVSFRLGKAHQVEIRCPELQTLRAQRRLYPMLWMKMVNGRLALMLRVFAHVRLDHYDHSEFCSLWDPPSLYSAVVEPSRPSGILCEVDITECLQASAGRICPSTVAECFCRANL